MSPLFFAPGNPYLITCARDAVAIPGKLPREVRASPPWVIMEEKAGIAGYLAREDTTWGFFLLDISFLF